MLRLAARMRIRPGMRLPAVFASRRLGLHGMHFATHAALAGMPFGGATLSFLAAMRQPLHLQYRLNWQGRIQVMRDLSALLVERVLNTRVMHLVERLLGRLAPALRSGHGGSVAPRSIVDRPRRQREARSTASLAILRAAAAPNTILLPPGHANPRASGLEHPRDNRQSERRVSWPAAWFARAMPGPTVRINASHVLLRHLRETFHLLRAGTPDEAGDAAYAMPGSIATIGSATHARHPSAPMLLALRAAAKPRLVFGLRAGETLLRWLQAAQPSRGSTSAFGSAFSRYLHTRMTTAAQRAAQSPLGRAARGAPSSSPPVRMAFFARPQTSSASTVDAASGWTTPPRPVIGSRSRLSLFRSAGVPGRGAGTLIKLFVSRLSHVFRQTARWRARTSGFARAQPDAWPADVQQAADVPALRLQRMKKSGDIARTRAAGFARISASARRQRLSLAPRLVSRHEHRATVSLVQGYEPALATAYGRGQPPPAVMAYREAPRPPELQWSRQVQRIEQQITRNIVQNISQAMPWRGDMEKAVLTPRVMRELADRVGGMLTQRIGLERYRRGL